MAWLSVWLLFRIHLQRPIHMRLSGFHLKRLIKSSLIRMVSVNAETFPDMLNKSHISRKEGRLGEVQLGVFLEKQCDFFVLVDFSQKEQQILLPANHQPATPLLLYLLPSQPGNSFAVSPPPLPQSSPQGQSSLLWTLQDHTKLHSLQGKIRAVLPVEWSPVQRPPPVDLPLPGGERVTCIVLGTHAFPHQARQMAMVSKATPSVPPPFFTARALLF